MHKRARLSTMCGIVLVYMLAGCASGPDLRVPRDEELATHMKDHFTLALQARDGVLRGDVYQSQAALIWLSQHSYAGEAPASWQPYIERMQLAARRALYADSLEATAAGVADMAAACGSCHRSMGRGPRFVQRSVPSQTQVDPQAPGALRPRMHEHAWAADQLWQGLVGPWEAGWSDGLNELTALSVTHELSPQLRPQLASIRALGAPMNAPVDDAARSQRYAAVISACGDCHRMLGVGP